MALNKPSDTSKRPGLPYLWLLKQKKKLVSDNFFDKYGQLNRLFTLVIICVDGWFTALLPLSTEENGTRCGLGYTCLEKAVKYKQMGITRILLK